MKEMISENEMAPDAEASIVDLLKSLMDTKAVEQFSGGISDLFSVCTRKFASMRSLIASIVSDFLSGNHGIAPIFVAVVGNLRPQVSPFVFEYSYGVLIY